MTRQCINLNRDWRFVRGDSSVEQRIGLPHTFDLPYFRTPEFYVGDGWYRKQIEVPSDWRDKRLFLAFDGVFQVAEVFVNDVRVEEHRGGYTGFCIDITDAIRVGGNEIAVHVNNNWDPQLAPRAGEHIFSGGIYRDVHLIVGDPLHVTWNGVFVTTPQVCRESAVINVKTEIRNDAAESKTCTLKTRIYDGDKLVASMADTLPVPGGQTVEFDQTSEPVANPTLWHPDHPNMHVAEIEVFAGGVLVDEYDVQFGIRWFEWTADRGFFLNGEHLYLRGANVHQDHAGWGIAVTYRGIMRDLKLIKEAGFNFVRGSHYPHHAAFARGCDNLGLLMWSENCFWGKGGFGPEGYWNASAYPVDEKDFQPFEASCRAQLREMIRINRNSPSIVAWSMTNEAFFTYNLDRARALISDLVRLSHELDPTRPAAIGGAQRGDVDKLGDIAGYNGDGARLFIDPDVPNMVSEYGAISKPHTSYEPFFGDLQSEEFAWRSGQAIWCAFDYGSIAGKQGLKGIIDHQRLPKRSWYWYRNEYRGIAPPSWPQAGTPAKLKLSADKTMIAETDATDDCQIIVTVLDAGGHHISNCPAVTLIIESGPGEFPTGRSITFAADSDIQIVEGQAAIAFRSYHGGETVIRATSPGLADATITITTIGEPVFVPGQTPIAADRPYVPPPVCNAARAAMNNAVNVALNRPSRASSEAEGHPARFANDRLPTTSWRAGEALGHWIVDLEGFYQLASLRLVLEDEANFRFLVELSNDAKSWMIAIDRSKTENTKVQRNDVFPPGATARYVRINFVHVPSGAAAGLREVELFGVLSVR